MLDPGLSVFLFLVYFSIFPFYHYTIVRLSYGLAGDSPKKGILLQKTLLLAAINFLYFTICSALGLGLLKNFALIWLLFYWELRVLLKASKSAARFLTLLILICTLSNILFFYSVCGFLINKPLSYFENIFTPIDFWKILTLSLAFYCSTFSFRHYTKENNTAPLRHLVSSLHQLKFLMMSMIALYGYLLLQGIMYSDLSTTIFSKLWSLAGCIFVTFGFIFTVRYAVRLSYLYHLDVQNMALASSLLKQQQDLSALIDAADMDTLTKVRNRRAGDCVLQSWIAEKKPFVLCMIDLDSLKYINDTVGHLAGDQYLLTVVEVLTRGCRQDRDLLYRYGGDEFLLAYTGMAEDEVADRLAQLADNVLEAGICQKLPMQLSYGIVSFTGEGSMEELLSKADASLYRMKSCHKAQTPQLIRS